MSTVEKQANNGVNVAALLAAREALGKAPEAARFNWRASCKWLNGTHSETTVKGSAALLAKPLTARRSGGYPRPFVL